MVRTRLNIGCRYSTPVHERPLHPTRSQFKPEPSQTQAPVTPATEPEQRAGGGLTTSMNATVLLANLQVERETARLEGLVLLWCHRILSLVAMRHNATDSNGHFPVARPLYAPAETT